MKTFDETTGRKVKTLFEPTPSGLFISKHVDAAGVVQLRPMVSSAAGDFEINRPHERVTFAAQHDLDRFLVEKCGVLRFDSRRATLCVINAMATGRGDREAELYAAEQHARRAWLGALTILAVGGAAVLTGVAHVYAM